MKNKIREYERNIENLEKQVSKLEKENADLRQCLLRNVKFSTKLSKIIYEMDFLLDKKGKEIRDLEKKLEESLAKHLQVGTNEMVMDFDMDLNDEDAIQLETIDADLKPEDLNVNDYLKTYDLESKKLGMKRDSNGNFKCPYFECRFKTKKSSTFHDHYKQHTDEKPFQCKLCARKFRRKSDCLSHIRGHDDRLKLHCDYCDLKFTRNKALNLHAKQFHKEKDNPGHDPNLEESPSGISQVKPDELIPDFDLNLTDEDTFQLEAVVAAIDSDLESEHLNVDDYLKILEIKKPSFDKDLNGLYKCRYFDCDFKTKKSSNIADHFGSHIDERPFQCKLCERKFRQKRSCLSHIRGHDDRLKLKCNQCDSKFTENKLLNLHTKKFHNKD